VIGQRTKFDNEFLVMKEKLEKFYADERKYTYKHRVDGLAWCIRTFTRDRGVDIKR